jgi:hypothetical protein
LKPVTLEICFFLAAPASDWKRVLPKIRFTVVPFNPVQQPFMAFAIVPIAVSRESQDRSLAHTVRGAKADLQIAGSFSLTQLAPVQHSSRSPPPSSSSIRNPLLFQVLSSNSNVNLFVNRSHSLFCRASRLGARAGAVVAQCLADEIHLMPTADDEISKLENS